MTDKSFLAGFSHLEFPLYAHVVRNSDLHSITFLFKTQKQECFVECFSDKEAVLYAGEGEELTPGHDALGEVTSLLCAACGRPGGRCTHSLQGDISLHSVLSGVRS